MCCFRFTQLTRSRLRPQPKLFLSHRLSVPAQSPFDLVDSILSLVLNKLCPCKQFAQFIQGDVAQLVRALPCHGRGRGFEPRRPRHTKQRT
jgi:hypothetical protein